MLKVTIAPKVNDGGNYDKYDKDNGVSIYLNVNKAITLMKILDEFKELYQKDNKVKFKKEKQKGKNVLVFEKVNAENNMVLQTSGKVVNPEIEKERQELEKDRLFLQGQKDDRNYEKYWLNSHKGEFELLKSFHFDVGCVLAKKITWLRHNEIAKKIDQYNKELFKKFGVNSFSKLFIDVIEKLRKAIENSKISEDEKKQNKKLLNKLSFKNLRTDLHMFKNFFTDEDFKILSEEVELLYSDRHKEIRKLHVENCYYTGVKNNEIYGYDVSNFSEKDVDMALEKFKKYKKDYIKLVNENSEKSDLYVKYIPEFFKLNDDSTADEILDCYIKWWSGSRIFEDNNSFECPNREDKKLKECGFICRLFYPREQASDIACQTINKAKEDKDFCKEYAKKEKILEERAVALNLKEKQFVEKQSAPREHENNNTNLFEFEEL